MKILFNGCSWTRGAELENIEEERFATLVCKELKADCDMLGAGGRGNHRITRTTLEKLEESSYDLAVIQLSQPSRAEFYRDGQYDSVKWHVNQRERIGGRRKKDWDDDIKHFWYIYYKKIYQDQYGSDEEKMFMTAIKNTCLVQKIPLILMTINGETVHNFDMNLVKMNLPLHTGNHPTKEGHQIISSEIIKKASLLL
tara:strand:+ start:100 stop:693 length:594 start_codon:yes stop_codon:yes gene_type:complete